MIDDFCIFILSHDRAGDIPTLRTLERQGYTGDWYIVIDHEDDIEPYTEQYGEENVIHFNKDDVADKIDRGDNFNRQNAILYARFHSFQLARDLGYTYFMQLDDDYTGFEYKFNEDFEYGYNGMADMTTFIEEAITYLEKADLDTIAMAQNGDFIGGSESGFAEAVQTKRKAMNTFICRSDNQFDFRGSINEDVNTYTRAQQYGKVFLTPNIVSMGQEQTQQSDGGLTDLYEAEGTYIKSFYTLLYTPSAVRLQKMGDEHKRIHHKVNWRNCVPKIVPESCKSD